MTRSSAQTATPGALQIAASPMLRVTGVSAPLGEVVARARTHARTAALFPAAVGSPDSASETPESIRDYAQIDATLACTEAEDPPVGSPGRIELPRLLRSPTESISLLVAVPHRPSPARIPAALPRQPGSAPPGVGRLDAEGAPRPAGIGRSARPGSTTVAWRVPSCSPIG